MTDKEMQMVILFEAILEAIENNNEKNIEKARTLLYLTYYKTTKEN